MQRFMLYTTLIYSVVNFGILFWLWNALQPQPRFRMFIIPALFLVACLFPILFRSSASTPFEISLLVIGSFWFGLLVYFFVMIIGTECVILVKYLVTKMPYHSESIKNFRCLSAFIIFLAALLIGIASSWNARHPILREIDLTIPIAKPLPENILQDGTITLAMLSDTHLGRMISGEYLADALSLLKPHNPQAIFFTGDLIDDQIRVTTDPVKQALSVLAPKFGSWGIMGNHEYISGPIEKSIKLFQQSGITPLRDQWTVLGETILLVGRDDYAMERFTGKQRAPLADILKDVPAGVRDLPLIVLDHQPRVLEEAEKAGAVLQLSGHTHNGQFWPINHIVKRMYENPYGLSVRSNTYYFVSLGTGHWGVPMRNTGQPEVLLFRIKFVEVKQ